MGGSAVVAGLFWAGIDWSERGHDVAVVDRTGQVVAAARVAETPAGVKELLRLLSGLRRSHTHSRRHVPVAIETSRGLLVEALRAARQPVVAINPSVVDRYRGRLHPARHKNDETDAALLANIIRTDGALHRPLPRTSEQADAITVLARAQRRAAGTRHHSYTQLRSIIREVHPAAAHAWAHLPGNLMRAEARAVLAHAPTPREAAGLTVRVLRGLLADAGRFRLLDEHATRLHALFHQPTLRQRPAVEAAMAARVLASLALLNQACSVVDELTGHLDDAFAAHPHAPIYLSFPGVGLLTGARLLGEIGDDPDRFTDARGLRAYAGAAPLTWASGTTTVVSHRRIANKYLMGTGHHWAFSTLTRSPGCRAHYDRRRAAGDRHNAALRHLYSRLLGCLHHCLTTAQPYAEQRAFPPT